MGYCTIPYLFLHTHCITGTCKLFSHQNLVDADWVLDITMPRPSYSANFPDVDEVIATRLIFLILLVLNHL